MGRSQGGLNTKIIAPSDAHGRLIRFALALGQTHDGKDAGELLDNLTTGGGVRADKG